MNRIEIIGAPAISGTEVCSSPEGQKIKTDLLAKALEIDLISNTDDRDRAIAIAGQIKGHVSAVEKNRVELKKPFLETGALIDACAKEHVKELNIELKRINDDVAQFNFEQAEIARKAEAARVEAARIALKKAADEQAEIERKAKEIAEAQLAKATKPEEKEAILQKVAETTAMAAEKTEKAMDLFRETPITAPAASGGAQRMETIVEVVDIHALYAYRPSLVRMEPVIGAIKILIDNGITVPGVKFTKKPSFSTRGVATAVSLK